MFNMSRNLHLDGPANLESVYILMSYFCGLEASTHTMKILVSLIFIFGMKPWQLFSGNSNSVVRKEGGRLTLTLEYFKQYTRVLFNAR